MLTLQKSTGDKIMSQPELSTLSDEMIFEEAAVRLKRQFLKDSGRDFKYGCFRFVFHDGRFQGVEDHPMNKRYWSPKRFKKTSAEEEI